MNMQAQGGHLMLNYLSSFTFHSLSSKTQLKVTWDPEWNVILRSVGRYHKSHGSTTSHNVTRIV